MMNYDRNDTRNSGCRAFAAAVTDVSSIFIVLIMFIVSTVSAMSIVLQFLRYRYGSPSSGHVAEREGKQ